MIRTIAVAVLMIAASFVAPSMREQVVTKPVKVGEIAPDFTLLDHHGNKQTLSDSKGKSPVVLVFYRGYW